MKCLPILIPRKACVMKLLIKLNQRRTRPYACSLLHLSEVQRNSNNRRKSKIKNSRTNEMQLISVDLRVLLNSSSRHMYEELGEKILQHNNIWNQEWLSVSMTGQILDSPPAPHSAPPQTTTMLFSSMKQFFEGSPLWAHLILIALPRHFWLPCAPFCCYYKPVAPLLEPHRQPGRIWVP